MAIKDEIKGKSVLFIPIYSTRSYKTGLYDLSADGNMARIISMILSGKPAKATILVPSIRHISGGINSVHNLKNQFEFYKSRTEVDFKACYAYGGNALSTRRNGVAFDNFLYYNLNDDFDYIIAEPNTLLMIGNFEKFSKAKIIYWCVASVTSEGTPWFTTEFADMDKIIVKKHRTECVLQTQVDALQGLSYLDSEGFYDASQFDYDTVFFPFRLTDKNYHAEEVRCIIESMKCDKHFKVLFTDPNASGLWDENKIFVKVPSQKEVYLQMLKSKPIVPYLEDVNTLTHINIHEMLYYGCRIIMFENETYKGKENVYFIKDINELSSVMKGIIEND